MAGRSLQAVVLTHLPFEDLGALEPCLLKHAFRIEIVDVTIARFPSSAADDADLLVVMGGPIGVYDAPSYPFLTAEIECIRRRLAVRKPTLGISLGAQFIAASLGACVYPGDRGPEIGWSPIQSPPGAQLPHWFMFLLNPLLYLFRWHEDTFDIPSKATHLAETQLYCNQALSAENFALGLQFHPEVTAEGPGALVCRACLRTQHQADQRLGTPRRPAPQFWNGWLDSLFG